MTLRARVIAYLAAVHLVFAALAVLLFRQSPLWLFAIELAFAISLVTGIHLARRGLGTATLGAEAARLVAEQELTSRLRPTGDSDADRLIALYNRIVDSLRAERVRVQEQQHFFGQVIGASPTGLVILDLDGRIADLNPAAERLLDVSRADAIGRPLWQAGRLLADQLAGLAAGESRVVSLAGPRRVRCQRGQFMDRGFPRSFFVIEELTEELRRFERGAYEKLIRVMSHEVNNTVTAANSLLQSSLTYTRQLPEGPRAEVEQAVGIVMARTEALGTFMRRFADVFRLPPPVRTTAVLQEVVEPLVSLLRARPEWARLAWTWEAPVLPVTVAIDRPQFEQAVLNILKNAAEAAGPAGHVGVRMDVGPSGPRLMIEDDGPGFGAEVQENLFTPFFSTKPDGQGIGLTLVQEILVAHGFDYRLERRGGLTVFTIELAA